MEDALTDNTRDHVNETTAALREQRERVREFLSNWRDCSESTGNELVAHLEAMAQSLSSMPLAGDQQDEGLEQRRAELADQEQRVASMRDEIAQREEQARQQTEQAHQAQADLGQRIEHLQSLLGQLDEREQATRNAESELESNRLAQQSAAQQLDEQRAELEQRESSVQATAAQLTTREKNLDDLERKTRDSRQQLARELKLQRKEQLAEINRRRLELEGIAAGEDAELEKKLAGFQEELSRLQQQTDQRSHQVEELRSQLESAQIRLQQRDAENEELMQRLEEIAATDNRRSAETAEMEGELAEAREKAESQNAASQAALAQARDEQQQLRDELDTAQEQLREAGNTVAEMEQEAETLREQINASGDEASQQRIRELESERDALLDRLSNAEQMSAHTTGANQEEVDELQQRYELALNDVRELKLRNSQLEEQISADGGTPTGGGALDWEAQKRELLAKLESDFDEDDPEQAENRMTVEGAINLTDTVVAQKERELNELRRLLDDQSQSLGGVAVGAATIADMLDGDDLVQQEREKLETLQQEWREKLRKAEIDISVERAKIARERAQLEEKLQMLEQTTISDGDKDSEPKRGKWLARLGLGDGE